MITLSILAEKARKEDFTITNDEAIDIWQYIPEGCIKEQDYSFNNDCAIPDIGFTLFVKGLGRFKIVK